MDIGQIIRKARKAKGWTLDDLSHQIGSDSGNLSRLERGLQGVNHEALNKILDLLEIQWIVPNDADSFHKHSTQQSAFVKKYPLINWPTISEWSRAPGDVALSDLKQWLASTENAGEHGFWLDVVGDSMVSATSPTFPERSRILIRPDTELVSGKYYVVKLLESGHETFKQYIEDAGHRYLKPLNPAYRVIEVNGDCQVIGRVIDIKMTGL